MRVTPFLGVVLISVPLFASPNMDQSVSFRDQEGVTPDCSALSVRFDHQDVAVMSETVPVSGLNSLRVRSARNGGIRVIGSEGSGYAVQACKAVAPGFDPAQVRISVNGNEVTADGADSERWIVYFIVQTPRNATLDLQSGNGPIAVKGFDGTLTAHVENGPLSLKESRGTIDATAANGPISVSGGSGTVKLTATNGPVSVKLDAMSWDGSLDASTQNGPVSLKVPRGFHSGVVLESLGSGPIHCRAEDCGVVSRSAESEQESPRRVELGSGPTAVHLSTVNGPISVKDR